MVWGCHHTPISKYDKPQRWRPTVSWNAAMYDGDILIGSQHQLGVLLKLRVSSHGGKICTESANRTIKSSGTCWTPRDGDNAVSKTFEYAIGCLPVRSNSKASSVLRYGVLLIR